MARIRYLKPDFFKDEDLAFLSVTERLTFFDVNRPDVDTGIS